MMFLGFYRYFSSNGLSTYLLVKNNFLFLQLVEVLLEFLELSLLLQAALHRALPVLQETTTQHLIDLFILLFVSRLAIGVIIIFI